MVNLSFKTKVFSSTAVIVFLVFFASIYSIVMINKTQEYANDTGSYWIPIIENCQNVINSLSQLNINSSTFVEELNVEKIEKMRALIENDIKKVSELKLKFDVLFSREEQKVLYSDFDLQWKHINELYKTFFDFIKDHKNNEANALLKEKIIPSMAESQQLFTDISDLSFASGRESTKKGKVLGKITLIVMICVLIFSAMAAILTFRVIHVATKKLINSVGVLKTQSVLTGNTGDSLSKNAEKFSTSIHEQTIFVKETAKLVNEIVVAINSSVKTTSASIDVIKASSNEVEAGRKIMEDFVLSMNEIQKSSMELKDIANIVSQINTKTVVINEIVSKTELLSLNASIESARAAEHGKGFAVVAEEVGNLAKVSGRAANEIQMLINSSQERVQQIINSTQEKIESGKKITHQAKENFLTIAQNISSIYNGIEEIIRSTDKQKEGVDKIYTEVNSLTKETEKYQDILISNKKLATDLVEQSTKIDNLARDIEQLIVPSENK